MNKYKIYQERYIFLLTHTFYDFPSYLCLVLIILLSYIISLMNLLLFDLLKSYQGNPNENEKNILLGWSYIK